MRGHSSCELEATVPLGLSFFKKIFRAIEFYSVSGMKSGKRAGRTYAAVCGRLPYDCAVGPLRVSGLNPRLQHEFKK